MSVAWDFTLYQLPGNPADRERKDLIEGWVALTISNDSSKMPVNVRVVGTGDEGREVLLEEVSIQGNKEITLKSANIGGTIPSDIGPISVIADRPVKAYAFVGGMTTPGRTLITGKPKDESLEALGGQQLVGPSPQVTSCCSLNSTGNPYPCSCGTSTGNCTWSAWKSAKDNWGWSLPGFGNAANWANAARANHILVLSTAATNTIAVNSTAAGGLGHVCYVTSMSGSNLTCTEMNWCLTCQQSHTYAKSFFNQGFIYPASGFAP